MRRTAFTLIELLVVVAIIALLIALFLPALASGRRAARATVGFANLRSLTAILGAYVHEQRDEFPNPFRPAWPATGQFSGMTWTKVHSETDPQQQWDFAAPLRPPAHTEGFSGVWYSYLAEYRNGSRTDLEQVSPADGELMTRYRQAEGDQPTREGEVLMPTSYVYPPTFWIKRWHFMGGCRPEMVPEHISTALQSAVTFPSAKVLLFERFDFASGRYPVEWFRTTAKTHVSLVDGSAMTVNMGDLYTAAMSSADLIPTEICCPTPPSSIQFFVGTLRGIQGRDLPR